MDRLRYEFRHLGLASSAGYNPAYVLQTGISQADNTIFSFEIDENYAVKKGINDSVEVYGTSGQYVRDWLIDHINGSVNSILVRITDTVCDKVRGEWIMKTDGLQWCDNGECHYRITLSEYTPLTSCLNNTLIDDNHRGWFPSDGFIVGTDPITGLANDDYMHPRYRYCDDIKPQILQNFIGAIAQGIMIAVGTILGGFVFFMNMLDSVWYAIFGSHIGLTSDLNDMVTKLENDIFGEFLGCNRCHPSPFVRNYFINACSKCNVDFQSSIFNDDTSRYYNLAHLFAPVKKGIKISSTKDWIPDNHPVFNAITYAEALRPVFNAKYRLTGSTFTFERKDYFDATPIFDLTGTDGQYLVGFVCYGWTGKTKPAYEYFKYDQDSFDTDGNEAAHRFNGIKDWNTANNPLLSGEDLRSASGFSPQRYTNDGIDKRMIFKSLGKTYGVLDGLLLMSADITSTGKLIIWDTISDKETAEAIRQVHDNYRYDTGVAWPDDVSYTSGTGYYVYNYDMYYGPQAHPFYPNLYGFFEIDDPNNYNLKAMEWNLTLSLCCYVVNKLLFWDIGAQELTAKVDYLIELNPSLTGVIQKIEVDYGRGEVRLTGKIR